VEGKATDDPEKSPYFAKAFHRNPCVFSTLFATGDDKHNIGSTGPKIHPRGCGKSFRPIAELLWRREDSLKNLRVRGANLPADIKVQERS
jgi:hypothetical protein